MAFADQQMSSSKIVSIVIVVLIHLFIGYALVTGLAYQAVKKAAEQLNVIDVKNEPPPKEPPPPPPKNQKPIPPPVVSPPPLVRTPSPPPPIQTVATPPPVIYQPPIAAPPAPAVVPPPPPPPPPPPVAKRPYPVPRGNPGNWVTDADYPSRALREEQQGTASFRLTVGSNGRPSGCTITSSTGSSELDAATCSNLMRRGRFDPALDASGKPTTGTYSGRITWRIPR